MEISKYARGLPALLGLKERGKGPPLFSDQVVGVVNLSDSYLIGDREIQFSSVPAAVPVGTNTFAVTPIRVPVGEQWWVWGYTVVATAGAGAAIDLCAIVLLDGLGMVTPLSGYTATAATLEGITGPITPFMAGPGSNFGFHVRSSTLVPAVIGGISFTRLKV